MYPSDDIQAELQDLWALVRLAQAGASQKTTPLVRTRWIDGDTTTPAAAANGSEGLPYQAPGLFFIAVGPGKSVADTTQNFVGLVSPATAAAYTANPGFPPYRNTEIRALASDPVVLTGNYAWANTAGAGGVFAPPIAIVAMRNFEVTGNFTYTDDAGAPTSELFFTGDVAMEILGNIVATGAAGGHLVAMTFDNGLVAGNLTSIASASGAIVTGVNLSTFGGTVTCNSLNAVGCSFTAGGGGTLTTADGTNNELVNCTLSGNPFVAGAGSNLTVSSCFGGLGNSSGGALIATSSQIFGTSYVFTATASFMGCTFSGVSPVVSGGTTATFDGPSWLSFLEAGGTVTAPMKTLVVGGSQAGLVRNATSLGNADVSISLNGTGASAGLTGGGNFYVESTALTGPHVVTVKTGGGELTGDTIDILKTDTAADTYTVKNNAGTTLMTIPVSVKGWARVQFNTTVAGDWGLVGGGSGMT